MIRAYRLYTGSDGNSHVVRGSVSGGELVEAESIEFKETPAHSSFDWHNDPIPQYVITLAGVLEFTTVGGETFTITPGDVLLAVDHTGSGHKWRLTNNEPWKRAYVVFKEGADTRFVPDHKDASAGEPNRSPTTTAERVAGVGHLPVSPVNRPEVRQRARVTFLFMAGFVGCCGRRRL